jgi:hypothetical protein
MCQAGSGGKPPGICGAATGGAAAAGGAGGATPPLGAGIELSRNAEACRMRVNSPGPEGGADCGGAAGPAPNGPCCCGRRNATVAPAPGEPCPESCAQPGVTGRAAAGGRAAGGGGPPLSSVRSNCVKLPPLKLPPPGAGELWTGS